MKPIELQNAAKPTFSEIASQAQQLADGASLHAKGEQLYVSSKRSLGAVKEFFGFPADRNARREAASQKIFEAIANEYGPAVANQIRDSFRGGMIPATKEALSTINQTLKANFRPLPQESASNAATAENHGSGPSSETTIDASDTAKAEIEGEEASARLKSLRNEAERLGMFLTVARFDRFDAGLPINQDEFEAMINDLASVQNRMVLDSLLGEFDALAQESELDELLAQVGEEPQVRASAAASTSTAPMVDTLQIDQLIAELMDANLQDRR